MNRLSASARHKPDSGFPAPRHTARGSRQLLLMLLGALVGGCAAAAPRIFPVAPVGSSMASREYDLDGDGRADVRESLGRDGLVNELEADLDGDGSFELSIDRATQSSASDAPPRRHLVILLDSVAFEQVRQLRESGRFRWFHPPSRVISPFPVMTDPCLNELFGVSPGLAVESLHFDGAKLKSGLDTYLGGANAPWQARCDYQLWSLLHGESYANPHPWFDHEMRRTHDRFLASDRNAFVSYFVSTSALMIQSGRDGHQSALIRLDRLCQQLMLETRGRLEITLLSDHGHNFTPSRRIALDEELRRCGYRVGAALRDPRDVVLPAWGLVTCASVHARSPQRVAGDLVGLEGVELAAYRLDDSAVAVLSRDGFARIRRDGDRYAYEAVRGDPLRLASIAAGLRASGRLSGNGNSGGGEFAADADWFAATADHEFPDPLFRLWRAFDGLFVHTPDVLLSLDDGVFFGSKTFDRMMAGAAIHGNLRAAGSTAFVMTTAGPLPPVMRMNEVSAALRGLRVDLQPDR